MLVEVEWRCDGVRFARWLCVSLGFGGGRGCVTVLDVGFIDEAGGLLFVVCFRKGYLVPFAAVAVSVLVGSDDERTVFLFDAL